MNIKNSNAVKKNTVTKDDSCLCTDCGKQYEFNTFIGHPCFIFHCSSCNTSFDSRNLLIQHKIATHGISDLGCTFCSSVFQTKKLLEIHMQACVLRRSNKRLSMDRRLCKICDRPLKSSYSLYCRYCFPIIKQQSKNENLSEKQCEISSTSQSNLETGCASKKSEVPPSETTNDQFDKLSVGAFQTSSSRMISKRKTSAKAKGIISGKNKNGNVDSKMFCDKQSKLRESSKKIVHPNVEKEIQTKVRKLSDVQDVHTYPVRKCKINKDYDKQNTSKPKNITPKKEIKNFKIETSDKSTRLGINSRIPEKTNEEAKVLQKNSASSCESLESNYTKGMISVEKLLEYISNIANTGVLIQSCLKNEVHFKCLKCGKPFKTLKAGSHHYRSCQVIKWSRFPISKDNIRWLCILCHAHFLRYELFTDHVKSCQVLMANYKNACGMSCNKCNFECISPLVFAKHKCVEHIKELKSCSVYMQKLPDSVQSKINLVLYECILCNKVCDEYSYLKHLKMHTETYSDKNFRPIFLNCAPQPIKSEIMSEENVDNADNLIPDSNSSHQNTDNISNFELEARAMMTNSQRSNFSTINLNVYPSTSNSNNQSVSAIKRNRELPSSKSLVAFDKPGESLLKYIFCKCENRDLSSENLCLDCLNKYDFPKMKSLNGLSFNSLPSIKKEKAKHQSGIHHYQNILPSSTVVENSIGVSNNLNVNNFTEFTPPTTPDTPLVQPNHGTRSVEEQNITDSEYSESALLLDLSHILSRSSDELPVSLYGSLHHVWNVENDNKIDVFAVVPDINNENVEKYICWKCVHFTCVDSNSIVRHYRQVHQVEGDIVAVYTLKEEEPVP